MNETPFPKYVDGKPRVSTMTYNYDIVEGNVPGHGRYGKMATCLAPASEIDVFGANIAYVFPTGAMQMEVVSSDANDTSAGTGVRTIRIWYLKSDYSEATTDVILNGTTPVATSVSDIFRVNNVRVLTTGTGYKAAGNIDVRHLSDTPIYSRINTGNTRARSSIFTVPLNKTYFIDEIKVSCIKGTTTGNVATFTLRATYDNLTSTLLTAGLFFTPYWESGIQDGTFGDPLKNPLKFIAGTDIKMSVTAGQASTQITSNYIGWLE